MFSMRTLALCLSLLVALLVAACGGGSTAGSSQNAAPLPLWQRVLQSGELAGFNADTHPPQLLDLATFVDESQPAFVQLTPEQASAQLAADGFESGLISGLHLPGNKNVVAASVVVRLGSAEQARRAAAFFTADSLKSCLHTITCDVEIRPFDIKNIDAHGVRRSRSVLTGAQPPDLPFEAYDVGFTDGPFLYDVWVWTPKPGMVSPEEITGAVKSLYARVHRSPPLPSATSA